MIDLPRCRSSLPVGSCAQRVDGLNACAGTGDYLPKTFQEGKKLVRLRSIVRRSVANTPSVFILNEVKFDEIQMLVRMGDKPVVLSPLEYRLTCYLMRQSYSVM